MISRKKLVALWLLSALPACKTDPSPPATESATGQAQPAVTAAVPSSAGGSKTPASDVTGAAPSGATPSGAAPSGAAPSGAAPTAVAPTAVTATAHDEVIEAGCTYDTRQLTGNDGDTYRISCPAGCEKGARTYGTGVYTADTHVCKAAIHAGAITPEGGTFTIRLEPGRPAYRGSTQNGVESYDYGKYSRSYAVVTAASGAATTTAASAAAPGVPSGAPGTVGASIEAGCTYDARQLVGNDGDTFNVSCPPGCGQKGRTYGTGVYTADTAICGAAIHAGAIKPEGGSLTIRLEPGRPAYRGSTQNGIKSYDYGQYSKSYAVVLPGSAPAPSGGSAAASTAAPSTVSASTANVGTPAGGSIIEAGCTYDARQLVGNDGQTFQVACPACEQKGRAYGTGVYTADTSICSAAVHAGAIKPEGGTVTIRLEPGRPAYRGSTQNGIKSYDYGRYSKSYAVVLP